MPKWNVTMCRDDWQLFTREVKAKTAKEAMSKASKRKWFKSGRVRVEFAHLSAKAEG